MKLNFHKIKNSYLYDLTENLVDNHYWMKQEVFSQKFVDSLYTYAKDNHKQGLFHPAKIGNFKNLDRSIRGDSIFWVDKNENSQSLVQLSELLIKLMIYIRNELHLPLKHYEGHFAYYPTGSFYKKHRDIHVNHSTRILTSVFYLSDSPVGSGGELVLYPEDEIPVMIRPQKGLWVIFDSRLEHEVLPTINERWALTFWFHSSRPI